MSFQDSADSWRAKLHWGKVRRPLAVGIVCVIVLILVVGGIWMVGAFPTQSQSFSIDGNEVQDTSDGTEASSEEEQPSMAIVHVSGAVASPGVYMVPETARVNEVIEAAGGMGEDAAPDSLNLARAVVDGEQIIVPTQEQVQAQTQELGAAGVAGSAATAKVNINSASIEQLDALPGIGVATAEKIIADREQNGPFSSPEDIKRVSGIGDRKYKELAELISVG